jgi:uncharacterized C2H2 Zn-finger protein
VPVEIAKRKDGAGVLRCVRDDGSFIRQKETARSVGQFFVEQARG